MTPAALDPIPDEALDAARLAGDPRADELLEELGPTARVNDLLAGVVRNDDPLPRSMPEALRTFLRDEAAVPTFAHAELLRAGHAWAEEHVFAIVTALFCATLPTMYAANKGVLVLAATRRLDADIDRRINETGRFFFDVIEPGALRGSGRGIRSCQKVRLIHAAVRRHVRASPRVAPGEVPINQEDMLGVLLGFSVLTLTAAKRLHPSIDARGEEAYFQLWRALSGILGVSARLVPTTLADAERLSERVGARQIGPSPHGQVLLRALLAGMRKRLAHPALEALPERVVAELCHPRVRAALALPEPPPSRAPGRDALADLLRGRVDAGARAFSRLAGRAFFEAWIAEELGGKRPTFRMPPETLDRWDLTST